ncbi:sensor histidine kinase [Streptomyces sp. NPDC051555]|uniref:sensor histidine kinase n=1 Tax=Streptomyces sp. NPDC051555 TaxID=3365657 RepID=UPI003795F579
MKVPFESSWTPRRTDVAVMLAAITLDLGNVWAEAPNGLLTGLPHTVVYPVVAVVGLLLWWRREHPRAVAIAVIIGDMAAFTPAALAVAMYTLGTAERRTRVLTAFAAAACVTDFIAIRGSLPQTLPREAAYSLVLTLSPLVAGYAVAVRHDFARATHARLEGLKREQRLLVERARSAERSRIAREMHDVVAHRVSSMVLTAGALQVGSAAADPRLAKAAEQIRSDGRLALDELREVLGILNPSRSPGDASPPEAPQPDATQLPVLVAHAVERGQPVELRIDGYPETLTPPVQRALYRTVQESLTNAAKYAPGAPVVIELACRLDGVHLYISNTHSDVPPSTELPSGGNGLVGLAERAALLHGTLTAGPTPTGGFTLALTLPTRHARHAHDGDVGRDAPA